MRALATWIEFGGALVIAFHVARAARLAWQQRSPVQARHVVAAGLVAGLDFKLAATLLKTLELRSWDQIAMMAAIFALRVLVKQTLTRLA